MGAIVAQAEMLELIGSERSQVLEAQLFAPPGPTHATPKVRQGLRGAVWGVVTPLGW